MNDNFSVYIGIYILNIGTFVIYNTVQYSWAIVFYMQIYKYYVCILLSGQISTKYIWISVYDCKYVYIIQYTCIYAMWR